MIVFLLAALVLVAQACVVLRCTFDTDTVRSTPGLVWGLALVAASLLGAFALLGYAGQVV